VTVNKKNILKGIADGLGCANRVGGPGYRLKLLLSPGEGKLNMVRLIV
jgi:hypothetical protein